MTEEQATRLLARLSRDTRIRAAYYKRCTTVLRIEHRELGRVIILRRAADWSDIKHCWAL